MIIEKIMDHMTSKAIQYPARSNRASEIGHSCALYLTFCRTNWKDRKPPDARLMMIFNIGHDVEARVIRDMQDAGITVIEQQRAFDWAEYQITGTVDCKVLLNGTAVPCEIKSASPFAFEKVNSVEDMLRSKYVYMRKYPAQLALYCLMSNIDHGLFLFKNKSTGAMKEIPLEVDFEYAEGILKRLEIVNQNIAAGTKPQPIDYDESICGDCPFLHICPVLRSGQEIEVVDDAELAEMLQRYEVLKPSYAEYNEVWDSIKKKIEGKDKVLIDKFFITGKWIERKDYTVKGKVLETVSSNHIERKRSDHGTFVSEGKTLTKHCLFCKKEMLVSVSRWKDGRGRYCSLSCRGKHKTGEAHHNYGKGTKSRRINGVQVLIYRIIAEKVLGRPLKKGEVVHHINGDRTDNRNENLLICTGEYHRDLHYRMNPEAYNENLQKRWMRKIAKI